MEANVETLLKDLHKLTADLESCLKRMPETWAEEAGERIGVELARARKRLAAIEAEVLGSLKHGTDATERYVRSNPWQSLGIAFAVAFVIGALASRRD